MRNSHWLIIKLLVVVGIVGTGFFAMQRTASAAVDPNIPIGGPDGVNSFCQKYVRGFMDKMHLTNSSGQGIDMAKAINVPIGATYVPFYFKFEMWFCHDRVTKTNAAVKTCSYGLILEKDYDSNSPDLQPCGGNWKPVKKNLLTNINATSEMYRTTDPMTSPGGTPHFRLTSTDVHSARLQTANLKEGANRICHVHSFYSYMNNPILIQGGTSCFTLNIKFGWTLSVNSQNRVKKSGSSTWSSYGNYREGSTAPRRVAPGDTVQWQHQINNNDKGTAKYERWRDRKGLNTTSYVLVGSHITNQSLQGGGSVRYPLDSSNVRYTIKNSDLGKTICERYAVAGRSSASGSRLYSIGSCVYVEANWRTTGTTVMKVNGATRNGTQASPTAVKVGDKINWTQTLRNNGPTATDRSISVGTLVQDYFNGSLTNQNVFSATTIGSPWSTGATRSWQNGNSANGYTYAIKPTTYKANGSINVKGDVGKTLCRQLQWNPWEKADNNSALTYSAKRCVTVAYNYNLIPELDGPSDSITPGGIIPDVRPNINNELPTNPSQTTETQNNVEWQLGRIDIAPGGAIPTGATNGQDPPQYYGSDWKLKDGAKNVTFPPGSTLLNLLKNEVVPLGTPIGTKICFTLSVRPYNAATANWRHGEPLCIGVNARPTVQVLGNDLRVGSAFQGGVNQNSKITGVVRTDTASWGEYGVLAPRTITNFASQSGGNGGASGSPTLWSKLTFANTGVSAGCGAAYGCYTGATNLGTLPNVKSAVSSVTYNGASINHNRGSASFKASDIPSIVAGANISNFTQSAAITTSGTITIDADITYKTGNISGQDDIPQLILIANNINIKGNVKRIDAWLIATGTINTCNDVVPTALRSTNCSNQLTINGATMANQLLLNRTYFDSTNPSKAAETFNLQGSSYVWASNVTRQNGVWQTVYATDLPPRY